ncbi:MAG: hypothetical protein C4523_20570 [Myxococcales bacterium]|nr:MAG: hypothetical protein C4523_20570 [Myxococcales bacterium]
MMLRLTILRSLLPLVALLFSLPLLPDAAAEETVSAEAVPPAVVAPTSDAAPPAAAPPAAEAEDLLPPPPVEPPPALARAVPTERIERGEVFLRLLFGLGYAYYRDVGLVINREEHSDSENSTTHAAAFSFMTSLGGGVADDTAVHFDANLDLALAGGSNDGWEHHFVIGHFGPGATHYFEPYHVFLSGGVGLAMAKYQMYEEGDSWLFDYKNNISMLGPSLRFGMGFDKKVTELVSLGMSVWLGYTYFAHHWGCSTSEFMAWDEPNDKCGDFDTHFAEVLAPLVLRVLY